MADAPFLGNQQPGDDGNWFTAIQFIAKQVHEQGWTMMPVKVLAVHGGGVGSPPTVDVQPTVNQLNGFNQPTEHGTIYAMPCGRIQGGAGAFICDPVVGDIGLAVFASHDITSVLATGDIANPGSRRRFSPSDGVYVITIIGAQSTTYIQLAPDGSINIVVPGGFAVNLTGDLKVSGTITAQGDVLAGGASGVSLNNHPHSGVTSGSDDSGPPVPG